MSEFPTPEGVREAAAAAYSDGSNADGWYARLVAAYAVDEPLIRTDERAKVLSEVVARLRDAWAHELADRIEREFGTEGAER